MAVITDKTQELDKRAATFRENHDRLMRLGEDVALGPMRTHDLGLDGEGRRGLVVQIRKVLPRPAAG
jgi:hypothetical protein